MVSKVGYQVNPRAVQKVDVVDDLGRKCAILRIYGLAAGDRLRWGRAASKRKRRSNPSNIVEESGQAQGEGGTRAWPNRFAVAID